MMKDRLSQIQSNSSTNLSSTSFKKMSVFYEPESPKFESNRAETITSFGSYVNRAVYSVNLQTSVLDTINQSIIDTDGEYFRSIRSSCGRYIYHLAIIDFLQSYNWQKKAERLIKSTKMALTGTSTDTSKYLSCVEPKIYKKRFLNFIAREVFSHVNVEF